MQKENLVQVLKKIIKKKPNLNDSEYYKLIIENINVASVVNPEKLDRDKILYSIHLGYIQQGVKCYENKILNKENLDVLDEKSLILYAFYNTKSILNLYNRKMKTTLLEFEEYNLKDFTKNGVSHLPICFYSLNVLKKSGMSHLIDKTKEIECFQ